MVTDKFIVLMAVLSLVFRAIKQNFAWCVENHSPKFESLLTPAKSPIKEHSSKEIYSKLTNPYRLLFNITTVRLPAVGFKQCLCTSFYNNFRLKAFNIQIEHVNVLHDEANPLIRYKISFKADIPANIKSNHAEMSG